MKAEKFIGVLCDQDTHKIEKTILHDFYKKQFFMA